MLCPKCSSELNSDGRCPHCGYQQQDVQTMSDSEARNYHGVTVEEENNTKRKILTKVSSKPATTERTKLPTAA